MITELDPGSDPRLAALFAAASAPAEQPVAGEPQALTAYRRSQGRSRFAVVFGARPVQVVAAAMFGGVLLAGGVATAATGSLPIVGHHRPAPATTAAPTGDRTDSEIDTMASGGTDTTPMSDVGDSGPRSAGHPAAQPIRGGVAKGAATCAAASHGTCQAGQHGRALAAHAPHHGSPATTRAHHGQAGGRGRAGDGQAGGHGRAVPRPRLLDSHGPRSTTHRKG
jgi:hypothetical protein